MADRVDRILAQWSTERPDLDASPMAVLGRLARAARLADARLAGTFAAHGLDAASFDVLATLRRSGAPYRLSPSQIQRGSMVTSSAIAQRVNRLERSGLVARTPSTVDARGTQVTLTEAGRQLIDRALPAHVANEERMLSGLSAEHRTQLAGLLEELCTSLGEPAEPADPGRPLG